MRVVHIEKKDRDTAQAIEALRAFVPVGRELTAADASALSGLPLDMAEPALVRLASEVPTRLRVTEGGRLLFTFAEAPRRRPPAGRLRRYWAKQRPAVLDTLVWIVAGVVWVSFGAGLSSLGSLIDFKPLFVTGMLIAVMALVPMALASVSILIFAASIAMGFERAIELGLPGGPFAALLMVAAGFVFAAIGWAIARVFFRLTGGSGLYASLRGFVLGPARVVVDPLADERRLTALVRAEGGVLTVEQVAVLFGWSLAEADRQLARILVDYGGDVVVSDEGAILFRFDPMLESGAAPTGARSKAAVEPAFRSPPPEPRRYGASRRFVVVVWSVILFGFLIAALRPDAPFLPSPHDFLRGARREDVVDALFTPGLGAWPYLLVSLSVAIRSAQHARLRRAFRATLALLGAQAILSEVIERGLEAQVVERDVDRASLVALGADITPAAGAFGAALVSFPHALRAARAAESLRAELRATLAAKPPDLVTFEAPAG